ncbi:hypothetical protein ACFQBY_08935 [Promicromonospora citrea]|uniref:Uncharacterized protein n=1 Tax=Promicromonospora citrea TaxID=43677 RepID=A0A8H9GCQ6_9MICO|nr:hypothetical protein [Promicromonospora citrea]GGM09735.1 hypothetical protein GCM10010102_01960 [Promicromonospora citrea]
MNRSARFTAAGAAALLAVGVLGAGAAAAADRDAGTDGTRVTVAPAGHDWNNGTRVTSVPQDDREY